MRVKGVTESQLWEIVNDVNRENGEGNIAFAREPEMNGRYVHFTLTVEDSAGKFARVSQTWPGSPGKGWRRVKALCWHGHRDVMIELFNRFPDAVLKIALATYHGKDGFEADYPQTGTKNIGSQVYPLYYRQACQCETVWDEHGSSIRFDFTEP